MKVRLPLFAAVVVLAAALAAVARGGSSAQDISWLNAQRSANGIPAGIVENSDWSAKCDKHISYLQKTQTLVHPEDPNSPYYSDDGNWGGTHSVLAEGTAWDAEQSPWETAPIHLAQLMSPQLSEMGVGDRAGYTCATTWPGYERPVPDTTSVVTYPGDGTSTYASEVARESPFTPEELLGIPDGDATGTNLYVYEWGPALNDYWAADTISITAASLTGPNGSVAVKWLDHTSAQIGPYLPQASGIIVPVAPLKSGHSYTASVTFSDGTQHSWTFHTRLLSNFLTIAGVGAQGVHGFGHLSVQTTAPNLAVTITYHGKKVTLKGARKTRTSFIYFGSSVKRGMRVCASSGGADSGYTPKQACKTL